MRYDSYDRFSNDYNPRRELYNDQSGKVEAMESGDARNYKPSGARRSPQITRAEMASPRSTHVTPASPRGSPAVADTSPAAPTAPATALASPASASASPVAAPSQPAMDAAAALLAQQEETMRQAREKAKLRKEEEQRVEEERRKAARKRAEELAKKAEARAKEKELEEQRQRPKGIPTGPSADRAKNNPTTTNDASSTNNNSSNGSTAPSTSPAAIWAPKRFTGKSGSSTWSPLSYDKPCLLDDPQSPEMRNGRGTSRFFRRPNLKLALGHPGGMLLRPLVRVMVGSCLSDCLLSPTETGRLEGLLHVPLAT